MAQTTRIHAKLRQADMFWNKNRFTETKSVHTSRQYFWNKNKPTKTKCTSRTRLRKQYFWNKNKPTKTKFGQGKINQTGNNV